MIEELDLSKVHLLKEIPDNFISENCKIETLFIPAGVKIVGDGFASSKSIREVYVPYTVEKMQVYVFVRCQQTNWISMIHQFHHLPK